MAGNGDEYFCGVRCSGDGGSRRTFACRYETKVAFAKRWASGDIPYLLWEGFIETGRRRHFHQDTLSSVKRARRRFCIFPPWAQKSAKSTSSLSMKSADLVSVTFASGTSLTWPPPPCAELSISSVRPHSGLSDKPGVSKNGCSSYAMPEVVLIFYSKFL